MNGTGRNRKQSNYLVILLLVVGLTAFSNSMKELSDLHQLFVGTGSSALAHWSESKAPAPPVLPAVVKVESCELKQSLPSVELSWLHNENEPPAPPSVPVARRPERLERVIRVKPVADQIAKAKKVQDFDFKNLERMAFEVQFSTDQNDQVSVPADNKYPVTLLRVRNRKHPEIRINPRDREMLKTLNRSINLRIAS